MVKLRILAALIGAMACAVMLVLGVVSNADTGYSPTGGRPFTAWSPWNAVIKTNPTLDAKSAGISSLLATGGSHVANLYEFGIPIYHVDASTPLVSTHCTQNWGTCPMTQVRIPVDAKPHSGSDGALVIVDWTDHTSYEFWQASKVSNTQWNYSWGGKADINGLGDGPSMATGAVAADTSRLAGVALEREIASGVIPHALVFSSKYTCPTYRYPARKSDGSNTDVNCIPIGARIQLDPSVNVDSLPVGQRAVAKALQTYGAYCIDSGGATMAFSFELPRTNPSIVYGNAGLSSDYYNMSSIPWGSMRLLANWDGDTGAPPTGVTTTPSTTTTTTPTPTTTPITTTTTIPTTTTTGPDRTAPSAPTGLVATGLSPISLKWNPSTDNVGVAKYNIWRGDSNWNNWRLAGSVNGSTTTFVDSTVPGVTYTYNIRAVDAAGNISSGSNTIRVTAR